MPGIPTPWGHGAVPVCGVSEMAAGQEVSNGWGSGAPPMSTAAPLAQLPAWALTGAWALPWTAREGSRVSASWESAMPDDPRWREQCRAAAKTDDRQHSRCARIILNHPRGKLVFHETIPQCQKAWGLLSYTISGLVFFFSLWHFLSLEKEMAPHSSTLAWKSHRRRSVVGYSPWVAKSRTRPSDFTFTFLSKI